MKYKAFISYNSKDNCTARWLQSKLENYSLPSLIVNEKGDVLRSYDRKPKKFRIFRYVTDLVAQNLDDGLRQELDQSEYLVVICSPNSANAPWVKEEVKYFIETGRKKKIIPFVIEGKPYSGDEEECFTQELKDAFPNGSALGVSLNDYGDDLWIFRRRKAVAKIVSLLIDLPNAFDFIWNRYRLNYLKAILVRVILAILVALSLVFSVLFVKYQTKEFDMYVQLTEDTVYQQLPPIRDVEVTIVIDGIEHRDTLATLLDQALFSKIHGNNKGKSMNLYVRNVACVSLDTTMVVQQNINIPICRNSERYGHIDVTVFLDGAPLCNKKVDVNGIESMTDDRGKLQMDMPIALQKDSYVITYMSYSDILYMPCVDTKCLELK